jgi:hypothetical protein
MVGNIAAILDRLETAVGLQTELRDKAVKQIQVIMTQLKKTDLEKLKGENRDIVTGTIGLLDNVSAVMFNPQPEPPDPGEIAEGLRIMSRVSSVLAGPMPQPPRITLETVNILNRIAERVFGPQAQPPRGKRLAGALDVFDRISAIAISPKPEPPAITMQVLRVLDGISAVLLSPKPEPPARDLLSEMVRIIDAMAAI